jgi:hypothetical protein
VTPATVIAAQPMSADQWERAWREHWEKTGFTHYELQLSESKAANGERGFLMRHERSLAEEAVDSVLRSLPPALSQPLSHRSGTEMKVKIGGAAGGEVTGSTYFVRAGQGDLLRWFSSLAASKPRVVLTHGENTPRNTLATVSHRSSSAIRLVIRSDAR